MKSSFKPDKKQIRQRRKEVVRNAIRSKNFSTKQLTKEASDFIRFTRTLEQSRKKPNKTLEK